MSYGYIVTFLVEMKCCKATLVRSLWRSTDVRLYCNFPGIDQMVKGYIVTFPVAIK